jgi:hypothetical protein
LLVKKDVFYVTQSGKFLKKRHFAGSNCFQWLETSYFVKLRLTEPYLHDISGFGDVNALWAPVNLPSKFRHPRDFTNKIPVLSLIFRTFHGPSFLLFEVLRSGDRCFTVSHVPVLT